MDLPTTAIGLIAFILVGFGVAIKYLADQNKKNVEHLTAHNTNTIETFMTYIKEKNANLERVSKDFSERMDTVIDKHQQAMQMAITHSRKKV